MSYTQHAKPSTGSNYILACFIKVVHSLMHPCSAAAIPTSPLALGEKRTQDSIPGIIINIFITRRNAGGETEIV